MIMNFQAPLTFPGVMQFSDYVFGAPPVPANANAFGQGGPVKETVVIRGTATRTRQLKGTADTREGSL